MRAIRCANAHPNTDANTYSDADRYPHGYGNFYTDTNAMHREMFTHAQTASDAGTSTVMDAGLATERFCPNVHFGDCAMKCAAADAQFFCGGLPAHSAEQRVLATATKL